MKRGNQMKHRSLATAFCLATLLCLTAANTVSAGNVNKAKDLIKAEMFADAIGLLKDEITENPGNAEAHFQLGVCYLYKWVPESAAESFGGASELKPSFRFKIGNEYKKAGDLSLKRGNATRAKGLYKSAIEYAPRLKGTIARGILTKGKNDAGKGEYLFSLAVSYDESVKEEVARYYYSRSRKAEGRESIRLLKKADEYGGGKYRGEIEERVIAACEEKDSPRERKRCMGRDFRYLSEKAIFESSVRYYSNLWGPPKVVELKEEWVEGCEVAEGQTIEYLSMEPFKRKNEADMSVWRASIAEVNTFKISGGESSRTYPYWFAIYTQGATVHVWVRDEL
jgi:tetratricopeptide (TPR) repeat protein